MTNEYIQIEIHNQGDLGEIFFQSGINPRLYLKGQLHEPTYEYEEEGKQDGKGDFFPSFQRWEKRYMIEVYAEESMVDFLAMLPMFDEVFITLKNLEFSSVKDIEVVPTWDKTVRCFANVKIYFNTETVVKTGCENNILADCFEEVYACTTFGTLASANFTDPVGQGFGNGDYGFFYLSQTGFHTFEGAGTGVYKLSGSTWVLQELNDFAIIDVATFVPVQVFKSRAEEFKKLAHVSTVVDETGNQATVSGFQYQQAFAQIQYSTDDITYFNIGDPVMSSVFENDGVLVTLPAPNTYYFRVGIYKHGCDVIYSDSETKVIT